MSISAKQCIETNNYEEAIHRYSTTRANWKNHWWNCIVAIYEKCEEFVKTYVLDFLTKEVIKIGQKTKATAEKAITKVKKSGSNVYLIKIFNEKEEWIFTKVGKANDIKSRMSEMLKQGWREPYSFKPSKLEVIKTFNVATEDLALSLESLIRNYLRKSHIYTPQDRFEPFDPTEKDFEQFDIYHKMIKEF